MEQRLKISDIVVEDRHRKTFGDLQGLAHSIKTLGLLQAVGVTKEGSKLLFGERRLRAVQLNGDEEIDCRILDIENILEAEHAENEFRASLTLTEKHALAEELKRQAGERRGGNHGNQHTAGKKIKFNGLPKKDTTDRIAVKAGFANQQEMRRVEKVVKEGVPELVEELDKGNVSVNTAFNIARKPKARQKDILDQHRGENGRIRPKGLGKSQAALWTERMEDVLKRILGVEEQFGSAAKMLSSALWATSTKNEKRCCIEMTVNTSEALASLARQLERCKRSTCRRSSGQAKSAPVVDRARAPGIEARHAED